MSATFRLTTFGGLSLHRGGVPYAGPAAQRRRLALLAVVAGGAANGVARERLVTLLWPDRDSGDPRVRHALEQALSQLRGRAGDERLVVGQAVLRLNVDVVTSDVEDFAAAATPERAAALYTGPFLDGFHLPDVPAFEQWADEARARLAAGYARLLDALARRAENAGDAAAAARWLATLAEADPLSDTVAERLLRATVNTGDHARATQFARVHEARVRAQLDTPPGPSFLRLAAQLRAAQDAERPTASHEAAALPGRHLGDSGDRATSDLTWREQRQASARTRLLRTLGGRYDLGVLLADGRVVARYAAYDRRQGLRVEVHAVQPGVAALMNPDVFVRTLRRVMTVAHPNVAPVLDAGTSSDVLFYVGAPAAGESLHERLRRQGSLALSEALRVARDLAAGLAALHERGVAHLDLRPKHVARAGPATVLGAAGVAAALLGSEGYPGPGVERHDGSRSALVALGDPAYLSPEQLGLAGVPDPRSDMYALGGLLFELLAGEPPFGRRLSAAMRKATQTAPPVGPWRDGVPTAVERFIARCLARVPADRYESTGEARQTLDALLVELEGTG